MAKVYKVWAVVEAIDEDAPSYEDVTEPAQLGEFETQAEAETFLNSLDAFPKEIKS
jgi:hypothetical protein